MKRRYRVYVGPTLVSMAANRLRAAGVEVLCEGTEYVYLTTDKNQYDLLNLLKTEVAEDLLYRDVMELK